LPNDTAGERKGEGGGADVLEEFREKGGGGPPKFNAVPFKTTLDVKGKSQRPGQERHRITTKHQFHHKGGGTGKVFLES